MSCVEALGNWLVVEKVSRYLSFTDYLNLRRVVSELHGPEVLRGVPPRRHLNDYWTSERIVYYQHQLLELEDVLLNHLSLEANQPEIHLTDKLFWPSRFRPPHYVPYLPCWDQSGMEQHELNEMRQIRLNGQTPDTRIVLPYAKSVVCSMALRCAKYLDFTTQLLYVPTVGEMTASLVNVQIEVDNHGALIRRLSSVPGVVFLSRVKDTKVMLIVDQWRLKGMVSPEFGDRVRYLIVVLHLKHRLLRSTLRLCGQHRFLFRYVIFICASHMSVEAGKKSSMWLSSEDERHQKVIEHYEHVRYFVRPTFNLLYRGCTQADAAAPRMLDCQFLPLVSFIDRWTQHEFQFVDEHTADGRALGLRFVRTVQHCK